jgi:hypothetical protein
VGEDAIPRSPGLHEFQTLTRTSATTCRHGTTTRDRQIHVRDAEVLGPSPGSPTTKVHVSGDSGPRCCASGWPAWREHPAATHRSPPGPGPAPADRSCPVDRESGEVRSGPRPPRSRTPAVPPSHRGRRPGATDLWPGPWIGTSRAAAAASSQSRSSSSFPRCLRLVWRLAATKRYACPCGTPRILGRQIRRVGRHGWTEGRAEEPAGAGPGPTSDVPGSAHLRRRQPRGRRCVIARIGATFAGRSGHSQPKFRPEAKVMGSKGPRDRPPGLLRVFIKCSGSLDTFRLLGPSSARFRQPALRTRP